MTAPKQLLNTGIFKRINSAELAVRMCEANYGIKRPEHLTAEQALAAMEDECREGWIRSAAVAMMYWVECIQDEIVETRKRLS